MSFESLTCADSSLLDAIPDSLIVCNHQGEILWCNKSIQELLGYSKDELQGQPVEVLLPFKLREVHKRHREEYVKKPVRRPMGNAAELFALAKDGSKVAIDIELAPLNWHGQACVSAVLRCRETKLAHEADQQKLLRENEERLRRSQAIAKIGTWDWNLPEDRVTWSEEIYSILGLPTDFEILGIQTVYDLVLPEDVQSFKESLIEGGRQGSTFVFEHRVTKADGAICHIRQNGEAFLNADGEVVRMLGTAQDITQEFERTRQLQLSQTIFESANDGIVATDSDFNIISVNPKVEELCESTAGQMLGQHIMTLAPQYARAELLRKLQEKVLKEGSWRGETELLVKNAPNVPVVASVALIKNTQGDNDGVIITVTDISKIKMNEAQLEFLAHYDQLTRLPNRTLLLRELTAKANADFANGSSLYVLYIDLDGFKQINDSQGHSAGDELLSEVAEQLRNCVPDRAVISRLGGDEFAVVCDFSDVEEVEALARKIIRRLQLRKEFSEFSVGISASVGIACCPKDGREPLELIKKADQAMYEAKANGKNGFEHYSDSVGRLLRQKLQITSDLAKALQQRDLSLMVQPKLNLQNPELYYVEALVRWPHPKKGLIPPDEFIPLAEESGQILDLGRQVLAMAAEFVASWKRHNDAEISVAVNLSARQLHDKHLLNDIAVILNYYDVDPSCFEFEVTESVVMDDVEASLPVLKALKKMGARFAIDDFGTGYSSLSYLSKLPIDVLKIDRSFISELPENQEDLAIVEAIISMAKGLNVEVVAEGVETHGQYLLLKDLGCEHLQGYFLSKPKALQKYLQSPWRFDGSILSACIA
ncbi:EAL domain-containing protein [uncultured Pseudoteredinibacter sp.]|uniref:sensor domain-containing protein n=1 Tax=uncultured Pseudoteredinibacter sp. TaxID=1641701 RepID=UPI002610BD1E|nr:EAL domain-containing protein [uncultured Pseudoteredinibacter sp.]